MTSATVLAWFHHQAQVLAAWWQHAAAAALVFLAYLRNAAADLERASNLWGAGRNIWRNAATLLRFLKGHAMTTNLIQVLPLLAHEAEDVRKLADAFQTNNPDEAVAALVDSIPLMVAVSGKPDEYFRTKLDPQILRPGFVVIEGVATLVKAIEAVAAPGEPAQPPAQ